MLHRNGSNYASLRFLGGTPGQAANCFQRGGWAMWNRVAFGPQVSYPPGRSTTAIKYPMTDGGAGGSCAGLAASTSVLDGLGDLAALLDCIATTGGAITGLKDAECILACIATTIGDIIGTGDMAGDLAIGNLTQDDVTGAILQAEVEAGLTVQGVLRLLLAVAAGKTDISGSVVTFRDVADTKDRIVATMTGSERTTVVRDGD
jgi:hypothetical protein